MDKLSEIQARDAAIIIDLTPVEQDRRYLLGLLAVRVARNVRDSQAGGMTMPTPDTEIDAAARRVFERLGMWKSGLMCRDGWTRLNDDGSLGGFGTCEHHQQEPHEIPPPDWRDPAVFLRLLTVSKIGVKYNYRQNQWEAMYGNIPILANDPRAALILALDH